MAAAKQISHMLYVHDAFFSVYIVSSLLSYCPVIMLFVEMNDHYITPCCIIPCSRDLMERNIYGRSKQIDEVIKQWETYTGFDHHAEQSYKELVPIRSDKCRLYDILWFRW